MSLLPVENFTLNGGDLIVFNATTVFEGLVVSELEDGLEVDVDAVLIDGDLFATEIDLEEEYEGVELEGTIADLVFDDPPTSGTFTLNGDTIVFNTDTDFDGLVVSDLEDGLEVDVDAELIDGVLFATEIELAEEYAGVELEGTIADLVFDDPPTSGTFTLNGDTIVFNADTVFDGLVVSELVDGLEVDVDAELIDEVLFATEIELAEEDEVELEGTIADLVFDDPPTSGTFTLNGDTIVFNTDTDFDGLVVSDLVDGLEVDVDAELIDGVLFATEIELAEEDEEEGSFGDKTTLCHIPPGNPGKAHTITVGNPAVTAHLAHGDVLESCTLGQEVSNFVHESRDLFKQQKEETKDVIAQCRADMQNAEPSDRKSVREDCKSNLKDIRESYKSLRETYRETYKAFGENMKVFVQESKGLPIDDSTRDAAIANIESSSDSDEYTELQQNIEEEVTVDKHELRKQMKKDRKIVREEIRDLREAAKDAADAAEDAADAAEDAADAAEDAAEAAEDPAEVAIAAEAAEDAEKASKQAKKDQKEAAEASKQAKKDRETAREEMKDKREAAKQEKKDKREADR